MHGVKGFSSAIHNRCMNTTTLFSIFHKPIHITCSNKSSITIGLVLFSINFLSRHDYCSKACKILSQVSLFLGISVQIRYHLLILHLVFMTATAYLSTQQEQCQRGVCYSVHVMQCSYGALTVPNLIHTNTNLQHARSPRFRRRSVPFGRRSVPFGRRSRQPFRRLLRVHHNSEGGPYHSEGGLNLCEGHSYIRRVHTKLSMWRTRSLQYVRVRLADLTGRSIVSGTPYTRYPVPTPSRT